MCLLIVGGNQVGCLLWAFMHFVGVVNWDALIIRDLMNLNVVFGTLVNFCNFCKWSWLIGWSFEAFCWNFIVFCNFWNLSLIPYELLPFLCFVI
jgi:hypothetical protein